jgi:tetratricopeptide (TPR) repeat protein
MKHSNIISLLLFIILILSISKPAGASDYLNDIVRANSLYTEKRYAESIQAYESLIHEGASNGYLHYNLGNAYIRLGKNGPAILNYIQAQKWIPRDENLAANLKFAIQQTQDKIEPPPPGTLNVLFFWVNDFNINELVYFTIGINFIFWITLILWMKYPILKAIRNALLCLLLLSFVSIGVKIMNESDMKLGVVLAENVDVKSGRAVDAITLFQLHEGALVTITDRQNDWLEVRLNDEQKGWVPQKSLGP